MQFPQVLAGVLYFAAMLFGATPATAAAANPPAALVVDANADGLLHSVLGEAPPYTPVDTTSAVQPYAFWLNSDQDDLDEYERWPVVRADATTPVIDSQRDLEDFTRLRIDLGPAWAGADLRLRLQALHGAPALSVFVAADSQCSRSYLLDREAAAAQVAAPFGKRIGVLDGSADLPLSGPLVDAQRSARHLCLLFDGLAPGRAALQLIAADLAAPQQPVTVWLDLRSVKTMYRRVRVPWPTALPAPWTFRDTPPPDPDLAWQWDTAGGVYQAPATAARTGDTLVWVYGWQREGENNYQLATNHVGETVFKRLWHRGYRGEVIFFHWATVKPRLAYGLLQSEYRALKNGSVLYDFVAQLPGPRVHVTAHSLGNVVLVEALRLGMKAEQAVLQQAAIPAGALDSRDVLRNSQQKLGPITYSGYLSATRTPLFNLYNVFDSTFVGWNMAQRVFKPTRVNAAAYAFVQSAPAGEQYQLRYKTLQGWGVRYVTDPHEVLAFITPARTQALGAEPRVRGLVDGGLDVGAAPFRFGAGHVVAWRWNPQMTTLYYNRLLDLLSLPYPSALL